MSTSVSGRRQRVDQAAEPTAKLGALEVVSDYAAAIIARNPERMKPFRAKTYLLDLVHLDAYKVTPQGSDPQDLGTASQLLLIPS